MEMERLELPNGWYLEPDDGRFNWAIYDNNGMRHIHYSVTKDYAEKFAAAMNAQAPRIERLEKALHEIVGHCSRVENGQLVIEGWSGCRANEALKDA